MCRDLSRRTAGGLGKERTLHDRQNRNGTPRHFFRGRNGRCTIAKMGTLGTPAAVHAPASAQHIADLGGRARLITPLGLHVDALECVMHPRAAEGHVPNARVVERRPDRPNRQAQATRIHVLNQNVLRALRVDARAVHRLYGEAVVLVPHGAVVDVDVAPGDVKAIRVERGQVERAVGIGRVDAVVDRAVANLEAGHVARGERPVWRLQEAPVLDQHTRCVQQAQQPRPILAVDEVLDVAPPRVAAAIERPRAV
eukprot:4162169-Prymnesium_polylepis.3